MPPATGPPSSPGIAPLNDHIQALQQENLDLRHHAEEREEELAAAREANRWLMTELNQARSWRQPQERITFFAGQAGTPRMAR